PEPSARQPVRRLVEEILKICPGQWVDGSNPNGPHEAMLLSLSIEKAGALLGWYPSWDFQEAIQRTVAWYYQRHWINNPKMLEFSTSQIEEYVASARRRQLVWAE
ncbi:MAG TPA: CDP-glucose 4,6-dehydratase, partial [Bacillota bacterium]|nr:CDP-glucose 4,6-dehydratase [Bacillota bacterium]